MFPEWRCIDPSMPCGNYRSLLVLGFWLVPVVLLRSVPTTAAYNTTFVQQRATSGDCWQYIDHTGGKITSHAGHDHYADNTDCKVTVTVQPGRRVRAVFDSFDITASANCYQDEVIVYDGEHYSSLMLSGTPYGLCGSELPPRYRQLDSTSNVLTVRFITDSVRSSNKGFSMVFSSFVPAETRTEVDQCFDCEDGSVCIDNRLVCDALWNCRDGSDENPQLCSVIPTPTKPIEASSNWVTWMGTFLAIIVASTVVILLAVSLAVYYCRNNERTDGTTTVGCGLETAISTPPSSCTTSTSASNTSNNSASNTTRMYPNRVESTGVNVGVGSKVYYGYPQPPTPLVPTSGSDRDVTFTVLQHGYHHPTRKEDNRGHLVGAVFKAYNQLRHENRHWDANNYRAEV